MQPDTCRLGMHTLLAQEIDLLQEFSRLLDREFAATTSRDIAALEAAIADKQALAGQLEQHDQQRNTMLDAAGFGTGPDGMGPCLKWCDTQRQLTSHWARLLDLAAECRRKNRKNRQLTELCSQHTHAALLVLRGEDPRQGTYGADGDTSPQLGSRSLARA